MRPLLAVVIVLCAAFLAQTALADNGSGAGYEALAAPPLPGDAAAPGVPSAPDAPAAYQSPISGGCYVAGPSTCRIHVEPITINLGTDTLYQYQVLANGQPVYAFGTDTIQPPSGGSYTPSQVLQDFAAVCGNTYKLNLYVTTVQLPNPSNAGESRSFTCPASTPTRQFMPGLFFHTLGGSLPFFGGLAVLGLGGVLYWRRPARRQG